MTTIQMRSHPASAAPATSTVIDVMDAAGLRVWDDMTVEVALSVMISARAGYLLVCDADSQCTSVVTHARLAAVRNDSTYTDRVRLRDIPGGGTFASPLTTVAEVEHTTLHGQLGVLPVIDEHGCALDALSR